MTSPMYVATFDINSNFFLAWLNICSKHISWLGVKGSVSTEQHGDGRDLTHLDMPILLTVSSVTRVLI